MKVLFVPLYHKQAEQKKKAVFVTQVSLKLE